MNVEVQEIWKKAVVACFKGPLRHSTKRIQQSAKLSVKLFGVPAEIRIGHLPNTR
jgi:hypothetical protein